MGKQFMIKGLVVAIVAMILRFLPGDEGIHVSGHASSDLDRFKGLAGELRIAGCCLGTEAHYG